MDTKSTLNISVIVLLIIIIIIFFGINFSQRKKIIELNDKIEYYKNIDDNYIHKKDSIVYNIQERDSIIYNIKQKTIYETEIIKSMSDSELVNTFNKLVWTK